MASRRLSQFLSDFDTNGLQALRYMKEQHDQGMSHDTKLQSQINLQARRQLKLDPQPPTPGLTTPTQKLQGLQPSALRPGLGSAPVPELLSANAAAHAMLNEPETSQIQHPSAAQSEHQRRLLHHLPPPQPPAMPAVNTLPKADAGGVKHWQGPLWVIGPKGEEFICDLSTDTWPAHLSRYASIFMPRNAISACPDHTWLVHCAAGTSQTTLCT